MTGIIVAQVLLGFTAIYKLPAGVWEKVLQNDRLSVRFNTALFPLLNFD
jgi:hypothetical protein